MYKKKNQKTLKLGKCFYYLFKKPRFCLKIKLQTLECNIISNCWYKNSSHRSSQCIITLVNTCKILPKPFLNVIKELFIQKEMKSKFYLEYFLNKPPALFFFFYFKEVIMFSIQQYSIDAHLIKFLSVENFFLHFQMAVKDN